MSDSETSEGGLNEPLLPPYRNLSPDNRGPIALATAVTLLVISSLIVLVKLWTRFATTRNFGANDYAIFSAVVFAIAQTACIALSVDEGLGRQADDISDSQLPLLSKYYYAANILLILSLTSAKAAVTLLVIAIKPLQRVMFACYAMLGLVGVWGIVSVFVLAFQCSPNHWSLGPVGGSNPQTCIDQWSAQTAIRAIDIATDVGIVLLPAVMMQSVQVSREKRWIVVLLFAVRLATPAFTAASIVALKDFYDASVLDRPFEAVTPSAWTSCALHLSIVTACIPSIKRFLADWAAGLSAITISEPFELEHSNGKGTMLSTYAGGSGMGSKIATKLGLSSTSKAEITSTVRSRSDREESDLHTNARTRAPRGGSGGQPDSTSESVKGLTDGVIMHSIDYRVEYEDPNPDHRDWSSRSSGGR